MDKLAILNRLFSGSKQLPTAPEFYVKFSKIIDGPQIQSSNQKIAELIMKDQAMVSRILRLTNSAMYSKRQEITSLTNAITYLGLETIKNLVLQISLVSVFNFEGSDIPEFKTSTFWEHSLSTAYFSNLIAQKLKIPPDENFYLGGLLHDVGKLAIYQYYPEKFKDIIQLQIKNDILDYEAEEKVMGVNHMEIGSFFGEKWAFKKEIIDIVAQHHNSPDSLNLMISLVLIANLYSKVSGMCFPWEKNGIDIENNPAWNNISKSIGSTIDIGRISEEITNEAAKVQDSVHELLNSNPASSTKSTANATPSQTSASAKPGLNPNAGAKK